MNALAGGAGALLFSNLGVLFGAAESITLTPIADTSLFENSPLNNLGAVQSLGAGNTARDEPIRALVKFDVPAAVPAGATITGARLQLTVVKATAGVQPAEFALHRMLVNWGEGDKGAGNLIGTGGPATDGDASWSFRFFPATPWFEPGGAAGTDYATASSALVQAATTEPLGFESSVEVIADVQTWLDRPAANFGWIIKEKNESGAFTARRLGSREHPTDPPRLSIDYTLPFRIRSVEFRAGEICLHFTAQAGKAYVVEQRGFADAGAWTIVTTLPVAEATAEVVICQPLGAGNQFYRVGEL
jgi:hypothetical protein